eukprot:scaffold1431_cov346-Pavlova_lutheri.AAC.13
MKVAATIEPQCLNLQRAWDLSLHGRSLHQTSVPKRQLMQQTTPGPMGHLIPLARLDLTTSRILVHHHPSRGSSLGGIELALKGIPRRGMSHGSLVSEEADEVSKCRLCSKL